MTEVFHGTARAEQLSSRTDSTVKLPLEAVQQVSAAAIANYGISPGDEIASFRQWLIRTDHYKTFTAEETAQLVRSRQHSLALIDQLHNSGLNMDESPQFAQQIAEGEAAREALIYGNFRYVLRVVDSFDATIKANPDITRSDAFQRGIIGLSKAIDRFDPDIGFSWLTYADYWIRKEVRDLLKNDSGLIRIPREAREKAVTIQKLRALGAEDREIVRKLYGTKSKVDTEALDTMVTSAKRTASVRFDQPLTPNGIRTVEDTLFDPADHEQYENIDHRLSVKALLQPHLARLDERTSMVIRMIHGLEPYTRTHTKEEIKQIMGLKNDRIRQLELLALTSIHLSIAVDTLVLEGSLSHEESEDFLAMPHLRGDQQIPANFYLAERLAKEAGLDRTTEAIDRACTKECHRPFLEGIFGQNAFITVDRSTMPQHEQIVAVGRALSFLALGNRTLSEHLYA